MKSSKTFAILLLSTLSLSSCGEKSLNMEEANVVIETIEHELKDEHFNFPKSISFTQFTKNNQTYANKHSIRFSLEDKYLYYSDGYKVDVKNEYWTYVEDNEIYILSSSIKNGERVKTYTKKEYTIKNDYFNKAYELIKNKLIRECDSFKNIIKTYDSIKDSATDSNIKIKSNLKNNLFFNCELSSENAALIANYKFSKFLPVSSGVRYVFDNKEELNYELHYDYEVVNITKPNIKNFTFIEVK